MLQFVAALTVAVSASTAPALDEVVVDKAPTLNWHSDYGKALAATRQDARPLLIVVDAPAEGSQGLSAGLQADAQIEKLLAKYDLCRVDVATPYGKKVADAFGAKQFPHVAIIDKSGAVVLHKQSGVASATQLKTALAQYQSGERAAPVVQTTFYRGSVSSTPATSTTGAGVSIGSLNSGVQSVTSPGYCPSCQRQAMGY